MVVKFEEFDISSLSFEKVQLDKKDVYLPRVNSGDCPLFQLPVLNCHGTPTPGPFFPTDKDRMFIQLVLEGEVLEQFRRLDEFLGSQQVQQNLFGSDGFEYQPIVKPSKRGSLLKVKLLSDHTTGDIMTITDSPSET